MRQSDRHFTSANGRWSDWIVKSLRIMMYGQAGMEWENNKSVPNRCIMYEHERKSSERKDDMSKRVKWTIDTADHISNLRTASDDRRLEWFKWEMQSENKDTLVLPVVWSTTDIPAKVGLHFQAVIHLSTCTGDLIRMRKTNTSVRWVWNPFWRKSSINDCYQRVISANDVKLFTFDIKFLFSALSWQESDA